MDILIILIDMNPSNDVSLEAQPTSAMDDRITTTTQTTMHDHPCPKCKITNSYPTPIDSEYSIRTCSSCTKQVYQCGYCGDSFSALKSI